MLGLVAFIIKQAKLVNSKINRKNQGALSPECFYYILIKVKFERIKKYFHIRFI